MAIMNMAQKIKNLRQQRGMTLEQVANIVGVGKSTVRKWETGMIANMKRDKIALLAQALGTTPAYLMGWQDEDEENPYELQLLTAFDKLGIDDQKLVAQAVDDSVKNHTLPMMQLSKGEKLLLDLFRQIPEEQQQVFLEMGRVYANSLKKD
ncbi:MAG: helix-turn-helix domain-containing protein [Eubacteriales bacterium]